MNVTAQFAEKFMSLFSGKTKKSAQKLRDQLAHLQQQRVRIYNESLLPLDQEINSIGLEITAVCEHPKELCVLTISSWNSDDGEGNSWNGDTFDIKCTSCFATFCTENQHSGYYGSKDTVFIKNKEHQKIWDELIIKAEKKHQKQATVDAEKDEKRLLAKLQRKYGKEA